MPLKIDGDVVSEVVRVLVSAAGTSGATRLAKSIVSYVIGYPEIAVPAERTVDAAAEIPVVAAWGGLCRQARCGRTYHG